MIWVLSLCQWVTPASILRTKAKVFVTVFLCKMKRKCVSWGSAQHSDHLSSFLFQMVDSSVWDEANIWIWLWPGGVPLGTETEPDCDLQHTQTSGSSGRRRLNRMRERPDRHGDRGWRGRRTGGGQNTQITLNTQVMSGYMSDCTNISTYHKEGCMSLHVRDTTRAHTLFGSSCVWEDS